MSLAGKDKSRRSLTSRTSKTFRHFLVSRREGRKQIWGQIRWLRGKWLEWGNWGYIGGFGCVCNLVMGQSVKVAIFEMSTNRIAVYIRLPQVAICLPNIQQIPLPGQMVRQNLYSTLLYYISQVIWVSKYSTGW